ncbi:MAG: ECF-type sigma factor [Candidatus Eisenbacteria bacterium]
MTEDEKEALFTSLYGSLREIAGRLVQRERPDHTLRPTALVHELWLRLVREDGAQWRDERHFEFLARFLMQRILREYARRRHARKRGGRSVHVPIEEGLAAARESSDDLEAFCAALDSLRQVDPRLEKVVHFVSFGMTQDEIAEHLGVSARTVRSDLALARTWLRTEMERVS